MTDETVEAVARAICKANDGDPDEAGGGLSGPVFAWEMFVEDARAAIAAHLKCLKREGMINIDWINENFEEVVVMDGYDDCILGVAEGFGSKEVVVYDREKVFQKLEDNGMTREEAVEWYEFNQLGAYVGENTPHVPDNTWRGGRGMKTGNLIYLSGIIVMGNPFTILGGMAFIIWCCFAPQR